MKSSFNRHNISEAERCLIKWGIDYRKKDDGTLVVADLDVSSKGLNRLPDLRQVFVMGDFKCFNNNLTSLIGSPQEVRGSVLCSNNKLETMQGCPQQVGGGIYCYDNNLTNLEGIPEKFWIVSSRLGRFANYAEIPEDIKFSPQTLAKLKEARIIAESKKSVVLQRPLKVRPIKFD